MMQTEVTQEMWVKVMGSNPSYFQDQLHCPETHKVVNNVKMCPNHPVEKVSYEDIAGFVNKVNYKEGTNFRLPTEAEWEYAARAGSKTAYSFGDSASNLSDYAWFYVNSEDQTQEVGKKLPNKF